MPALYRASYCHRSTSETEPRARLEHPLLAIAIVLDSRGVKRRQSRGQRSEFSCNAGRRFRSAAPGGPIARLLDGRQFGSTPRAAKTDRRIPSRWRATRDGRLARERALRQAASINTDLAARSSNPVARHTATARTRQRLRSRKSSRTVRRNPNHRISRAAIQKSIRRTQRRRTSRQIKPRNAITPLYPASQPLRADRGWRSSPGTLTSSPTRISASDRAKLTFDRGDLPVEIIDHLNQRPQKP